MPTLDEYDELAKAARELIAAAKRMHPRADAEKLEIVCTTAIKFEIAELAAAA